MLFKVRGSGSFLDESRAEAIAGRIVEVARDTGIAPESLRVEERPLGSTIVAGKLVLMTVLDADARIEGIERPVLAQVNLMQIRQAITRYRSDREQPALLRSAAYASAAVVLLGVVLYVLRRLRHFVDGALERRYRARLDHLEIGGFKVLHAERLWGGLRSFVAACFWLLSLSVAYADGPIDDVGPAAEHREPRHDHQDAALPRGRRAASDRKHRREPVVLAAV